MNYKNALIIFLLPFTVLSQVRENNGLSLYNPVSPKSETFLRFGDIPVNKYAGLVNLTIPIYTIKAKGLDIPISLEYNSNGAQVSQEAEWTGLGWNLNGGGTIVQQINSFDDFTSKYKSNNFPDLTDIFNIQCNEPPLNDPIYANYGGGGFCPDVVEECDGNILLINDLIYNVLGHYLNGIYGYYHIPGELTLGLNDFEPDLFKFSMPGYSGEFIMDWENNNFVCLTDRNTKIEAIDLNPNSGERVDYFVITVPEGHKFTFHLKEVTKKILHGTIYESGPPPNPPGNNTVGDTVSRSFQLTKIVTNQGDVVNYGYTTTPLIRNIPSVQKSKVNYHGIEGAPFPNSLNMETTSYDINEQIYSYIDAITFNNGALKFKLSERLDQIGAKKLDKIELKENLSSTTVAKTFNFTYDYFIGHSNGTNYDNYLEYNGTNIKTAQELTHRLKLNSFEELGTKPYTFEYNIAEQLPKKNSWATDYWGYYNGVLNNTSPYPNIYAMNIERGNASYYSFESNNKGSSLDHTLAGVLKKVTYPTGGHSIFRYELNSFENTADLSPYVPFETLVASVNSRNMNGMSTIQSHIIENDGTHFKGGAILSTRGCTQSDIQQGANEETYIRIRVFNQTLIPYAEQAPNYGNYGLTFALHTIGILNESHPQYNSFIEQDLYLVKSANVEEYIINNLSYTFDRGIIVTEASGGCGIYNGTQNSSHAHMTLTGNNYIVEDTYKGAGLRINEILNFEATGNITSKKQYFYEGGRLLNPTKYYVDNLIENYAYIDGGGVLRGAVGNKGVLSNSNFIPAKGYVVGYDNVKEYNIHKWYDIDSNIGIVSDYYLNYPNGGSLDYLYLPGIPKKTSGLPYKQELINQQNEVVKVTQYGYEEVKWNCFWGMRETGAIRWRRLDPNGEQDASLYPAYNTGAYPIPAGKAVLRSLSVTDYFDGAEVFSKIEYEYNDNYQENYRKETTSAGELTETFFSYPVDMSAEDPVAAQMVTSNVLSPVLKTWTKLNSETTQTARTTYFKRSSSTDFSYPDLYSISNKSVSKAGNPLEEVIRFNSYDTLGNPMEITLSSGSTSSFIWGYNKKYLLAKVEGAPYSAVTSFSGSLVNLSNSNNLTVSSFEGLRNMPNVLVTGYIYDPLDGLTHIINPDGTVQYYQYDTSGRLMKVKDHEGKELKKIDYHYKPQP